MIAILVLLLTQPLGELSESVDSIELNHFHDANGCEVYTQVIFYRWCEFSGRRHVRAWMLVDPKEIIAKRPMQSYQDNRFHVRWFDAYDNVARHVTSNQFTETWTQSDPERENRKLVNESDRIGLYRPHKIAHRIEQ
jgi:hypothetical protein